MSRRTAMAIGGAGAFVFVILFPLWPKLRSSGDIVNASLWPALIEPAPIWWLWMLSILLAWLTILAGVVFGGKKLDDVARRKTQDRLRLGCCIACGYSLAGNVSGVCPECGATASSGTTPLHSKEISWMVPSEPRVKLVFKIVLLITFFFVLTFVVVAPVDYALRLIVPHLPWIQKPYVDPDSPPLILAFRCACLFAAFFGAFAAVLLILPPERVTLENKHLCHRWIGVQRIAYESLSGIRIERSFVAYANWCLIASTVDSRGKSRSLRFQIAPAVSPQSITEFLKHKGVDVSHEA